ncbi:MAG: exodeoxyribonuclease VII large subunit [Sphingomonadales bacterium]|nr:exodeoxyribonuclease VII large subunit [Sphingomonadales bacterium]
MSASGRLVAHERSGDNAPPLTVGEISGALKRVVENEFGHVRVRGEISGFKRAASGHCYLALKDERAVLDAVLWKGQAARLAFAPEDGVEVIATGRLTTYPGRSKYQIVIDSLELAGEGALMALFEKLKAKLRAEGLFDRRRRDRPFLPRTIGVVTSPTGAVIRDILHRLEDRCPAHVLVWPVRVQGEGAAAEIAAAVRGFDALAPGGAIPRPDLVIVARGGGSIEDLWAFNEELVVRAVADCSIPTISAVGHETDTTLCDYAADARAPTPTAAAEMAMPVRAELRAAVRELGLRGQRALTRQLDRSGERLRALARLIPALDRLVAPQRQRLDDAGDRLVRGLSARLALARQDYRRMRDRLAPPLLARLLRRDRDGLAAAWRMLESLDPRRVLARGYAMVTDHAGKVIASASRARAAGAFALQFADGTVAVALDDAAAGASPPAATPSHAAGPKRPRKSAPGAPPPVRQDDLFE